MWDPFSNSQLSCKVFLGGLAWDISEQTLVSQLKTFGNVRVDWPSSGITSAPKGYLYVIFENESQVIF
jgi:cytoplasmic polyadenylation element-binding protein